MKKTMLIAVLRFIIAAAAFFITGYAVGRNKNKIPEPTELSYQVFYAEITDLKDNHFSVKGLDVNDVNYRGEFTFSASEDTELEWRGEEITLSDFNAGDRIMVVFDGEILETYPAQIPTVIKLQLLDDEK